MFSTQIRFAIAAGVLGVGAMLAGYQNTAMAGTSNAPTNQQTASCPKCRMVTETNELAGSHRTPATPVMRCEDCTNAVTNFLTKGEFKHTCATCGDKTEEMCKH